MTAVVVVAVVVGFRCSHPAGLDVLMVPVVTSVRSLWASVVNPFALVKIVVAAAVRFVMIGWMLGMLVMAILLMTSLVTSSMTIVTKIAIVKMIVIVVVVGFVVVGYHILSDERVRLVVVGMIGVGILWLLSLLL